VVILGGGNAGIGVTGPVRRAGMSMAMIEARDLGGTCPNRGCTQKKILVAAGHALHEIERAGIHKISVGKPKLDWAALIDREKEMIKDIPDNLARATERRQVEVIRGQAAFAGPDTIRVGDRMLKARYIVIATGSKSRPLTIPGAEHMITSDEMLSERELPPSVIFIGGGVISLEFGHVYARAGAGVTILEALPQLLPAMDADAVAHLAAESERVGIRVKTGVSVKRIEPTNGRLRVIFMHEGTEHAAQADRVVNGAGRIANVDTLGLASGNVDHANGRVSVDRYLRSASNPLVLCLWRCAPDLAATIAAGDLRGRNRRPQYSRRAQTLPGLRGHGNLDLYRPCPGRRRIDRSRGARKGFEVEVHANDMLGWFSAKTYAETAAWSKIIVDRATDRILGAHFVGHEDQELINLFGLAIKFGITAHQLRELSGISPRARFQRW
jgi:glutathione reductase (NADPH)